MKLGQIKPKRLLRALLKLGFAIKHRKGSHVFIERTVDGEIRATSISLHDKPMPKGTLYGILDQTGVVEEDLRKVL